LAKSNAGASFLLGVAGSLGKGLNITAVERRRYRFRLDDSAGDAPSELLGKMNGAFRFCVTGIMPFDALFGGWLGSVIGVRPTLVVAVVGVLASCLAASYSH
jgi:hypothetical protein